MVKPSLVLKRKRLREKKALEEAQHRLASEKQSTKPAESSSFSGRKIKGVLVSSYKGCLIKRAANAEINRTTQAGVPGRNPYEQGSYKNRRYLIASSYKNSTSSKEIV